MYLRNMFCFRYIIVNIPHEGDNKDDDDDNDDNNNIIPCGARYPFLRCDLYQISLNFYVRFNGI
jgi:hypothetical protein